MTGKAPKITVIDGILILIVVASALTSGAYIYGNQGDRAQLVIESPSGSWIYDLNTERSVEIPGELGATVVQISGKEARIIESACPNKTCVAAHPIARKGEWIACLPNKVILRIEGANNTDGIDAIAE